MAEAATWARRVAEWRSSGLTSARFCEGKAFSAGGLRHWSYRLGKELPAKAAATPRVRMARVLRSPAAVASSRATLSVPARTPAAMGAYAIDSTLVVELAGVRVSVRPGFDRDTLSSLLDVLAERGGAR